MTPRDIAMSNDTLIRIIQKNDNGRRMTPPKVLLLAPIPLREETFLGEIFGNRREDSLRLGPLLAQVAEQRGCAFLSAADYAEPSALDGLHMDREGHKRLAAALAREIPKLLA